MSNFSKLNSLLKEQSCFVQGKYFSKVYEYAEMMAEIEKVIAVVSDLKNGTCKIFCGGFAETLGITSYTDEDSIWEKRIISRMSEIELEEKVIAELRFFHFLKRLAKNRQNYYLMSKLRISDESGEAREVLHRMYYIYDPCSDAVRYALCLYGPLSVDFKGKSVVVNSLTGHFEELTNSSNINILSPRERQVLSMIESGMKSEEIAESLHLSKYTVSRHRQSILSKLQVKNSIEACRIAKNMNLI